MRALDLADQLLEKLHSSMRAGSPIQNNQHEENQILSYACEMFMGDIASQL